LTIVLDTGVVVALMDRDDRNHDRAGRWLQTLDDDLVTTPLAVAEMDHFAGAVGARDAFRDDLERGAYVVRWWADALSESVRVARARPGLGMTDASLVALAQRLGTNRIATFDHRHFSALTDTAGETFVLLPADHT
jgi:predicted nucleic acid-binding protein